MKRDLERERPRRGIEWIERKRLGIEEEKLESSRDFKEITFAITLFGGLLAFLIKLGDYFNNNVVVISGYSLGIIYITIWLTFFVLVLLFPFLILKWYLVSTDNKNKFLINITQFLFGLMPVSILAWLISLISSIFISYYKNTTIDFNKYSSILIATFLLIAIIVLTLIVLQRFFENKPIISLNKIKNYRSLLTGEKIANILNKINVIFVILAVFLLILVLLSPFPAYLLTGSYSIEKFPPSDTNHDIITFTIKETGISYSNNFITLSKLETGNGINHYIDNITINATHEKLSENKLMLGKNHNGIWYLNLNTSNLTSGNYMLHAEVTDEMTKNSTIKTIRKHDDILFYIPPKTEFHSYNSTKQE
ncbi:MAG: hypothetical protein KAT05_00975 [Spirochaetes bacterium]|nr:hypothetical protein [Spirochaetota bacterium]